MVGGKRHVGKAKFTPKGARNDGDRNAARAFKAVKEKEEQPSPKEPIDGGHRKREYRTDSDSEDSRVLPKQKKIKLLRPFKRTDAAASGLQSSKNAKDSPLEQEAHKVARNFTKSSSEDGPDLSAQSRGPETPQILALASEPEADPSTSLFSATTDQHETALRETPSSLTHSDPPRSGAETPLVKDLTSPHPDRGIPFGRLQCLKNPKVFFTLRKPDDGSEVESLLFGYDRRGCDFVISGPAQGIGHHHCYLNLELSQPDDGPLRRRVVASKIQTALADPSLRTTVWIGGVPYPVEDELELPPGAIIQFGNGEKYAYYGPDFSALYFQEQEIHDHANSGVTRAKRISDRRPFVAKKILKSHSNMARTEVAVYRALNSHPKLVQFIEAFHEGFSGAYHLILEAGEMDLHQYASRMRARGQRILTANAPQWIEQIARGVEHNIAHRDMKPKNIIVFISKTEGLTMKLGDMGIARPIQSPL
ncbi:Cyclin-dependent kinase B1-1 [Tulasnella sp. 408]|nr:Cyclin-dependent kinase B1-1 [Tulasnella sp. 408]